MTDDEHILLSAVRYSLGRHTYIVSDCARWVRERWPSLGQECRLLIRRDVTSEVDRPNALAARGHAVADVDRLVWLNLLAWMGDR